MRLRWNDTLARVRNTRAAALCRVDRVRGAILGAVIGAAVGSRPNISNRFGGKPPEELARTGPAASFLATARYLAQPSVGGDERTGLEGAPPGEDALALDGSFGCAAALRTWPVGLVCIGDLERAGQLARVQARMTHQHPLAVDGATLLACAVARLANEDEAPERSGFVAELRDHVWTRRFQDLLGALDELGLDAPVNAVVDVLGNGPEAHRSVPTALYASLRCASFADAVRFATGLGGASVAIGAMTGALAGASTGARAIPAEWKSMVHGDDLLRLADALDAASCPA